MKFCPDFQQQQAVALPPPPPGRPSKPRDEYESSGGDSEDDYVQERPQSTKIKKRSSLGRKPTESGEQRKRKRKQPPPPVDFSDLPPEQGKSPMKARIITNVLAFLCSANKLRLDMKIDEILRSKKSNRPRKKKTNDEVLDSFADDEVARLREAMNTAADEDIRSNNDKLPATAKLRLLPEAMDTLRKCVCIKF